MRLLSLIITLSIIGFLVKTQLDPSSSSTRYEEAIGVDDTGVPKVPTSPKEFDKFEKDMTDFMQSSADKRKQEIEDALK
ncbi:MAG: hypothetical protein COA90_10725 [Gammaproteobacteria bacterium]|nr:MAG: hypothetical protein COA90_10725 [Gammaproteobacteria bacterium]